MEFEPVHSEDLGEHPPIDELTEFMIDRYLREQEETEAPLPTEYFDEARKLREEQIRRWIGHMGQ